MTTAPDITAEELREIETLERMGILGVLDIDEGGSMTYRSKKIRDAANGQPCVQCGADDDTVVHAHLAWPGIADRGMGHKCHDFWGAHLCARCHHAADSGEHHTDLYWRTQAVAKTLARLFSKGVIRA